MTDNRTTELREKLNKLIIEIERLDIKLDSPAYGMTLGEYEQEREKLLDEFEQAIATTLGNARAERGTLTAEQVRETVEKHWHDLSADYDMPEATALPEYSYDWQAIADELNAELWGGNCARCAEDMGRYADSLCDPLKERIAELLRCLENDWHIRASWDGLRKFWCIELTEEGVKLRDAERGTLTAEQVRETVEKHWHDLSADYDMPEATALPEYSYDWQAIADELNARAERTCKCVSEYAKSPFDGKTIVLHRCSECHELMRPHMLYCPNCGCKVVDE